MNSSFLRCFIVAAALAALCACGSAPQDTSSALPLSPQRIASHAPPSCTPTVWASSLGTNAVYGFTAANTAPCITLNGVYNGLSFNAPIALALTRSPKWLYVADLNNDRIVIFTYAGAFVKTWTTDLNGQAYQPWGVCASPKGIIGVGNRQFNNTGAPGNAEFFTTSVPNGGSATGYATGVLNSDQFCAFDVRMNFFVDGAATSGGQKIAYLSQTHVNLPAQTLVDSGRGSAFFWVGMYSRNNSPVNDTLSVGTSVGSSATQHVKNWRIAGPPAGPLTFTAIAQYTLTSYPVTSDAVYQLAPSQGGVNGQLFIADYGASMVLQSLANGGPVATYNGVSGTVGVTTQPTGQY